MAYTTIDDPSAHFHTRLYSGNGQDVSAGGNAITNNANAGNFQPDWVWIKTRGASRNHNTYDSSRGVKKALEVNDTPAESTVAEGLQSFDTNGFTVGSDSNVNQSTTIVAWQWKANGGTTSSNSGGDITSTVQANTTAGFSIVTWTGNATNPSTIGHGLNQKPDVILLKNRDSSGTNWIMYHSANTSAPETDYLILDSNNATTDSANVWSDTEPTSSVFTVGSAGSVNNNGDDFITYCFHSVQGYSKFGSYTGNGSTDGTFVYTGFKPAFVMIKRTDSTSSWSMRDTSRSPFNVVLNRVWADLSNAEGTSTTETIDILSNGFKARNNIAGINTSGGTYIYMAFAEHPFVSSKGVPVTAR